MVSPQIICLNGTSSAGKTAIAKQLQEKLLPTIYLNFSIDSILYTLPPSALDRMTHGQDIADLNYPHLVGSFNACVARLVELGHFLVIDNAMDRTEHVIDLLERVQGYSILLVGVHCSLEELNRRERQRQDRTIGKRLRSSIGYIGVSCMMLKSIRALKAQLSWPPRLWIASNVWMYCRDATRPWHTYKHSAVGRHVCSAVHMRSPLNIALSQ